MVFIFEERIVAWQAIYILEKRYRPLFMLFTLFVYFAVYEFSLSLDLNNWIIFLKYYHSLNGLYKEVWFTKVSCCSLPMASALVIVSIAFSNKITFVSSAKILSLVSVNCLPNSLKTSIIIWTFVANLCSRQKLSPYTSSQDHGIFFVIAKRGWSTVNTGTFPRFSCSVALAMTSMPCFTNASECALSWNNGMISDIAGGLREASCNVAKCADQEILPCAPNWFIRQLIDYLCAW